LYGELNPKFSG